MRAAALVLLLTACGGGGDHTDLAAPADMAIGSPLLFFFDLPLALAL